MKERTICVRGCFHEYVNIGIMYFVALDSAVEADDLLSGLILNLICPCALLLNRKDISGNQSTIFLQEGGAISRQHLCCWS